MTCPIAATICISRGSTPSLMARIEGRDEDNDSVVLTISDVATVNYSVIDIDDLNRESAGGTLDRDDVFYDELQTGSIWTIDTTGFNFLHQLPASAIDHDSHSFVAEYVITLVSGAVLPALKFPINASRLYQTTPS